MVKAIFIKELRDLFLKLNQNEKRYSQVWLSDANFGGLYYSGKYILNLKSEHHLDVYKPESRYIYELLDEKLGKEKASYIYSLSIYNDNEFASPDRDDIIVYNDEVAYNAA